MHPSDWQKWKTLTKTNIAKDVEQWKFFLPCQWEHKLIWYFGETGRRIQCHIAIVSWKTLHKWVVTWTRANVQEFNAVLIINSPKMKITQMSTNGRTYKDRKQASLFVCCGLPQFMRNTWWLNPKVVGPFVQTVGQDQLLSRLHSCTPSSCSFPDSGNWKQGTCS